MDEKITDNTQFHTGSELNKTDGFSGFTLKMIAVVTMFIDHMAAAVGERILFYVPQGQIGFVDEHWQLCYNIVLALRSIGRMAFPIYCFLLVEGLLHTKNAKKYTLRMLAFAFLSEIPFDLAFNHTVLELKSNNVFWTLWLGLVCMIGVRWIERKLQIQTPKKWLFYIQLLGKRIAIMAVILITMGLAEYVLCTDYGASGIAAIMVMYLLRNHRQWAFGVSVVILGLMAGVIEFLALLMLYPLSRYNGTRGRQMKYFFYAFYPVHLIVIVGIVWLMGLPVLL